ncbi:DNA-binding transcriptional regulator, XRE-family HTH domain [Eubacterium aggregans]|uniref:DNA-binding transcriptional regulator, XRE-family HTH domain n=1 Tax=Eubacterium aggregans TaxID=81409 RepID=A0A1H4EFR8_9FIRM|nr:DUF3955 domain-containing protein [Eubacterium aggregans]SEA83914.1 DNA-binding transcriptional regulator, XRE-family HTH domain [Eubacterium aggregans]
MKFSEQIRWIRTENELTQEQLAEQLGVSRQAISNWENNRNLPDIEILISITKIFHLSLDYLILGDDGMGNMAEKLVKDGSENRRAKMNLISISIGAALLFLGIACIGIKAVSVEYVDAAGVLHENFFLLPMGFLFLFSGFIIFLVTGIRNIVSEFSDSSKSIGGQRFFYIGLCLGVVLLCLGGFLILLAVNAETSTGILGIAVIFGGVGCFIAALRSWRQ